MVSIAVVDNGKGIDAATQERLFEPFFTTRTDGTGLGLAIVRGVAEAHRGSVQVKSAPGRGSEFILRLPKL
jgi:two-component system sensor histidine kinase FlrB